MVKVMYKMKKYEIPSCITCARDGGLMVYMKDKKAYECINVEGCNNKVSLPEYLVRYKAMKDKGYDF